MRTIRFVKNHLPYMAGEIAGFPEATAAGHIGQGVAVAHAGEAFEAPVVERAPETITPISGDKAKLKRVATQAAIDRDLMGS